MNWYQSDSESPSNAFGSFDSHIFRTLENFEEKQTERDRNEQSVHLGEEWENIRFNAKKEEIMLTCLVSLSDGKPCMS